MAATLAQAPGGGYARAMIDDDVRLAHRLADAAGAAIRPLFRADFGLEYKDDASPVTRADRVAEAAIRAILEVERPDDGIIGEEYGTTREGAARAWVLDPIDGTRAFVTGRPLFGTLIALIEDGVPVLGLIDQPVSRERWVGARGRPTMFAGAPARTRGCATIADAYCATTSPAALPGAALAAYLRVADGARDAIWGGDCYNYGLLAIGQLDCVIEVGLKLHDYAALVPVVEGAGGAMRDWSGRPLDSGSDGRVVAAGDERLLEPVLRALGG